MRGPRGSDRDELRALYLLPDFAVGGGQVILRRTIEALDDPAWRHIVAGFGGGPLLDSYRDAGIDCRLLGDGSPKGWPAALVSLVRLIRAERVDVVVSLNTPLDRTMGQIAAAITGRPVVVWFMSIAIPRLPFPPPPSRILAFAKRWVLYPFNHASVRRLRLRLTSSAAVARSFADHLGLDTDDFVVVPPGLPDTAYDHQLGPEAAATLRRSLGLDATAHPVLINVGMLIPLKGQLHLVDMMDLLADDFGDAHLLLVGEGPDRAALEERIGRSVAADRIHLLGRRHDVPDLLAVSDGLLSASRSEGFGVNVLEAMGASLPVVAVRTPAFEEFLDADSAVLVEGQDARRLADGVREVFASPERAAAMGRHGRELAEGHRLGLRARQFASMLRVAAGGDRRPLRRSIRAARSALRRAPSALRRARSASGRPGPDDDVVVGSGPGQGLRLDGANASADYADPPERPVQEALAASLFPGMTFYDVGANVGFFSLLAARLVGEKGSVVAFEPVEANAAALDANAARNGFTSIAVRREAVGAEAGRRQLFLTDHPGGATLDADDLPGDLRGATMTGVVTIDDVVAEGRHPAPDVVKIDVEGAESDVLDGMAATLAKHQPVLLIELDGPGRSGVEAHVARIERQLAAAGYEIERLDPGYPDSSWTVVHLVGRPAAALR